MKIVAYTEVRDIVLWRSLNKRFFHKAFLYFCILGVIRFGKAEEMLDENIGEVLCLYVKVGEKRKGIGTKLLEFAKHKLI